MQLFNIAQEEISPVDKISPQDIGLVYHEESRNLYVYKGDDSLVLDEFQSEVLYERILNRFLNTNIYFLQSLIPTPENSAEILEVKSFLFTHLASSGLYSLKKFFSSLISLRGLRNRIKTFKNYEKSYSWRSQLTHPRKFWRLEVFNFVMVFILFAVLLLQLLLGVNPIKTQELSGENWFFWVENLQITLGVCLGVLSIMAFVNGIFLFFPMKYPTRSASMGKLTKDHQKELLQISQNEPTQSAVQKSDL